ncbi:hypothetical protein SLE2022_107330 [Rubroshorea leprosula]
MGGESPKWLLVILFTALYCVSSVSAVCDFSFINDNKLYNFSLVSPLPGFPHGVLSEDGFYKVTANETVLWFQLCDGMVFNHEPPTCVECLDCGGPAHCGIECSALAGSNVFGYPVCTAIGHVSKMNVDIIDKNNPRKGVIVRMSSTSQKNNCSLSVSVICDSNGVQGPDSMEILGNCNYATMMRHPSGCATIIHVHGKGWGWFGTLLTVIFCVFGAYLLAGTVYRFFILGVRGIDVIPNLELWGSIPHRIQRSFSALVRRFRGPSEGYRSSYSAVNF